MFILMLSIVIALIIVIFAVQNAAIVPVQFLAWSTELPLVLVIFCSVFAGALLMFCLALWRELKKKINTRPKLEIKKSFPFKKEMKNEQKDSTIKVSEHKDSTEKDPIDFESGSAIDNPSDDPKKEDC